jgi:short-subunit dehydrogenase
MKGRQVDLGLNGKVVMISGASRGIGRAIAMVYAQERARLSICARNRDGLHEVAQDLSTRYAVDVFPFVADMNYNGSASAWVQRQLNILVTSTSSSTTPARHRLDASPTSRTMLGCRLSLPNRLGISGLHARLSAISFRREGPW